MGKYGTMRKHHKISGRPASCARRMAPRAGVRDGFCQYMSDARAEFSRLPVLTAGMPAALGAGMT